MYGVWLKNLAPVLKPMKRKNQKQLHVVTRDFSRALDKLQVITYTVNSDWFTALFSSVVISWSNYFVMGFSTVT